MYVDHEGNRIGDTTVRVEVNQTREAHPHYRGAAHTKVPLVIKLSIQNPRKQERKNITHQNRSCDRRTEDKHDRAVMDSGCLGVVD